MNILSFDIEEWYLRKEKFAGKHVNYSDLDVKLEQLLSILEETQQRATFFCLGKLAVFFPDVIRKISACGHEIGCHSDSHLWCNKMSDKEFEEDTHRAIDSLQQCIGKKILSYRAPAFSIGEHNLHAFEILLNQGIVYDSSVFPAYRDIGGFPTFGKSAPTLVRTKSGQLKEFPIPIISVFGKKMAWSGGGYFRMFPYPFVSYQMNHADYVMTYFHLADLLSSPKKMMSKAAYENYFKEPGTLKNRVQRYLKSNIGTGNAMHKLTKLLNQHRFVSIEEAGKQVLWCKAELLDINHV